ncbi:MAG: tRNA 2-thiouridine(34) synthase MnmA [Chloroflexota bacterium]|nr:tRNA 2-thiouridine(34) synthase MnmA [Chloroflexota bacterium]
MLAHERVFVAMSGGVDSSVAAALLVERGYRVQGVTMRLWREESGSQETYDGVASARAVCEQLGIEHRVLDLSEPFLHRVVEHFVGAYAEGRTPNPCVRCNRFIKFGKLLDQVRAWGANMMATGHYARRREQEGRYQLLRGLDEEKDQSYFLYMLGQYELRHILFPLGTWTKGRVYAFARTHRLPVARRPESQDICFIRDGDYRRFLAERIPRAVEPGPIYNREGDYLGQHKGLPFYTIGQREGLGISAPRPLYVLEWDVERNALIVGFAEELGQRACIAEEMSYVSGLALAPGCDAQAQIRYRARPAPARVWSCAQGRARIVFRAPLRDITPGQAVVLYDGERVLGGGIISRVLKEPRVQE